MLANRGQNPLLRRKTTAAPVAVEEVKDKIKINVFNDDEEENAAAKTAELKPVITS